MYRLSDYRDEFDLLTEAAAKKGVALDFYRGTWGAREVAYFLGVPLSSVRNRKAGLSQLPSMRMGATVCYYPQDVIGYREKLRKQAIARTPAAILEHYRQAG